MAENKHTKRRSDPLEWVKQKAAEVAAKAEQKAAETPRQMFLPGMDEFMRAMPNHIARSSLFAPVARGRKRMHQDTVLQSRGDAEIRFWGEQLDEAQADVWMQCMKEAQRQPLGTPVVINRAAFLREIGRQTGNYEYKWLHRTMKALSFAMLVIEVTKADGKPKLSIGKTRALHLITGFDYDEDSEEIHADDRPPVARYVRQPGICPDRLAEAPGVWAQSGHGQDATAPCGHVIQPGAAVRAGLAQEQDGVQQPHAEVPGGAGRGLHRAGATGDHRGPQDRGQHQGQAAACLVAPRSSVAPSSCVPPSPPSAGFFVVVASRFGDVAFRFE